MVSLRGRREPFASARPTTKMKLLRISALPFGGLLLATLATAQTTAPQPKYPDFPSETPAKFEPVTSSFDHTTRDVMIPVRDGVKLHTVIVVPKGARRATEEFICSSHWKLLLLS